MVLVEYLQEDKMKESDENGRGVQSRNHKSQQGGFFKERYLKIRSQLGIRQEQLGNKLDKIPTKRVPYGMEI